MKNLTRLVGIIVILSLALSLGIAGCKPAGKSGVAATVNGKQITMKDLDKEYKRYQGMTTGGLAKEQERRMKKQLLFTLMEEALIEQEAEKNKIKVTDKEINDRYKQFQAGRSQKEFKEQIKKAGLTEEALKKQIKKQLLQEKLINKIVKKKKVTEKEIKEYYNKNKSQFTGPDNKPKSYKEVKPQIKQMLESQKEQEARSDWLDEVKASSDVRMYYW